MRYSESEIVEDFLEHIRQAGGDLHEWRVGTATDARDPILCPPTLDGSGEALIYREAYTTFAAEEVVDRLARGFDLSLAPKTSSDRTQSAAPAGSCSSTARPPPPPRLVTFTSFPDLCPAHPIFNPSVRSSQEEHCQSGL
jgi:hypothetical protein